MSVLPMLPNPLALVTPYATASERSTPRENEPDELPDCTTPQRRTRLYEEEALTGHSRYSAYRMFKEDKSGVLEPGKLADLEVLDRDYMPIPANDIRDLKSLLSLVDGRIVYQSAEYSN